MKRSFAELLPTALNDDSLAELAPLSRAEDLLLLLERWFERGWVRALDKAFVAFLHELDPEGDPLVLLAAALTSHQLGHGHVCLDLFETLSEPDFALSLPPEGDVQSGALLLPSQLLVALDGDAWCQALQSSPLVAQADDPSLDAGQRPLVLSGRRLYLRRYWSYERRIDSALRLRLAEQEATPDDLPPPLAAVAVSTGRSSPAPWPRGAPSASSPAAPAPARPPPWCACWPCSRRRRWRWASRCAFASPPRPARPPRA